MHGSQIVMSVNRMREAAIFGDLPTLRSLVRAEAGLVSKPDGRGSYPIIAATCNGHAAAVRYLIENGADVNVVSGMLSRPHTHPGSVGIGSERDIDCTSVPLALSRLQVSDRFWTPLYHSCVDGRVDIAVMLLEAGAVPDVGTG
jgi:ankyrin repeat protein